jgi:hypothetical protein
LQGHLFFPGSASSPRTFIGMHSKNLRKKHAGWKCALDFRRLSSQRSTWDIARQILEDIDIQLRSLIGHQTKGSPE